MILVKELNQRKNKIFYIVVICLTDVKECEVAQFKKMYLIVQSRVQILDYDLTVRGNL